MINWEANELALGNLKNIKFKWPINLKKIKSNSSNK